MPTGSSARSTTGCAPEASRRGRCSSWWAMPPAPRRGFAATLTPTLTLTLILTLTLALTRTGGGSRRGLLGARAPPARRLCPPQLPARPPARPRPAAERPPSERPPPERTAASSPTRHTATHRPAASRPLTARRPRHHAACGPSRQSPRGRPRHHAACGPAADAARVGGLRAPQQLDRGHRTPPRALDLECGEGPRVQRGVCLLQPAHACQSLPVGGQARALPRTRFDDAIDHGGHAAALAGQPLCQGWAAGGQRAARCACRTR